MFRKTPARSAERVLTVAQLAGVGIKPRLKGVLRAEQVWIGCDFRNARCPDLAATLPAFTLER